MSNKVEVVSADLLRRLVVDDPITFSREGLDDGCFWCDAAERYDSGTRERYAVHTSECPWMEARYVFDLPIGKNRYEDG